MTGGIGPVEPGDGTAPAPDSPRPRLHPRRPGGRPARRHERYRRPVLAAALALVTLAGAAHLYASRPQPPPAPPPPYPSQAVGLAYAGPVAVPSGAPVGVFGFAVLLSVRSGPPVTVTRLAQPYDGVTVTSSPTAPFQTKSHSARKIIVTLRVTQCEKAPRNAGLPFLDVTLRNARAMQTHSFILGPRYTEDLTQALEIACSDDSR